MPRGSGEGGTAVGGSGERPSGAPTAYLCSFFGGTPTVAKRQSALVRTGDRCQRMLLLASGWAARERLERADRRVILDLYLPGDLIGLDHLFGDTAQDTVVALTAITYYSLPLDQLRQTLRGNAELALDVARCLSEEKQRLERLNTHLAVLSALERTMAGLHDLCGRLSAKGLSADAGGQAAFRLPLTQQQLADYLGLHVMHLSRTLRTMRAAEIVKVENGTIVIENVGRLAGTPTAEVEA